MNSPLRKKAADIVRRVEQGAYTNLLLNQAINHQDWDTRDKALLTKIVKGTLQWKTRLDAAISPHVDSGIKSLSPDILSVLRTAAYQLLFLDKVPDHAVINESVELVKNSESKKASGLVNAVLRRVAENKESFKQESLANASLEDMAIALSHPEWLVKKWIEELGEENAIALMEQNNEPWPLCIRTNTLKISTEELRKNLAEAEFRIEPCKYDPDCSILHGVSGRKSIRALPGFTERHFYVQDESSSLVTRILNPMPGSSVIDLCSSPGGKTASLALLMQNKGKITAVDLTDKKNKIVKDKCSSLGIQIVETLTADATTVKLEPADYVLVDAPCSGLGVLGRKPEIRWNRSQNDIEELTTLQTAILQNAAYLLKSGGKLVYSTCTLLQAENQKIIEHFLENPEFKSIEVEQKIFPEIRIFT
ncbi:MAG: 16S rRNA (cytosine(967)-C(5))-methyltransferase RsmB [Bdellovibrionota bacterium]